MHLTIGRFCLKESLQEKFPQLVFYTPKRRNKSDIVYAASVCQGVVTEHYLTDEVSQTSRVTMKLKMKFWMNLANVIYTLCNSICSKFSFLTVKIEVFPHLFINTITKFFFTSFDNELVLALVYYVIPKVFNFIFADLYVIVLSTPTESNVLS